MIGGHTFDDVRRYDLMKLIVAVILILLLLLSVFTGVGPQSTGDELAGTGEGQPLATAQTPGDEAGGGALGALPALLAPVPGGDVVQSTQPSTLSGTAAPGSTIQVLVDGELVAETTADESGAWSAEVVLNQGATTVAVQTVDAAGVVAGQSAPIPLNVRPPVPPAVEPLQTGAPYGETVLRGTAEANLPVDVLVDGQLLGQVTAGPDGRWELPVDLAIGPHEVVAQTLFPNGELMVASAPATIVVPNPLAFAPLDDGGLEFDPLTGDYILHGTAVPGDNVQILVDGQVLGTTEADEAGNWTLVTPIPVGEHTVQLQTVDDDGNVLTQLEPFNYSVGAPPPNLDMPGLALPDPVTGLPVLTVPAGPYLLRGEGVPGTQVQVTINGQPAGTAVVNSAGVWTLDVDLPAGSYQMQMATLDATGATLATTAPFTFSVVEGARPSVNAPGGGLAAGPNTLTGSAAPDATVAVLVNGQPAAQATAGADGAWTAEVILADGLNEITVQTQSADGTPLLGSVPVVAPINTSVLALAASTGEFDTLLAAVESTGLAETLNGQGPFTLFAPTDAAFEALPAGVLDVLLNDPEALSALLQAHVVPGQYLAADVAAANSLQTVNGAILPVTVVNGETFVGNAPISDKDVLASNGVIHIVNEVMLPVGEGMQPPVIDETGVPTFTGSVLTVVGEAEPATRIEVRLNGEPFGEVATVDDQGFWQVSGPIEQGQYQIVAYMLNDAGALLGISKPVDLLVP